MQKDMCTIKVDEDKYVEVKNFYKDFIIEESHDYVDYVADYNGVLITGYLSTKKNKSIVFKGEGAELEASKWGEIKEATAKKEESKGWLDIDEQIGSDEVGVGDYFLPMIVVATLIKPSQIKILKELGVTDSKKINDAKIREIAPKLLKEVRYSKLTISNEKYNQMIAEGENINSLKAKMHHRALKNIHDDYLDIQKIYVDQFVNEKKFYDYLDERDEPILRDIAFKVRGESAFPSVACASVIARYSLLFYKDELDKKYGLDFPFGASKKVDEFAAKIKKVLPKEEFDKLVKKNFKNYERD